MDHLCEDLRLWATTSALLLLLCLGVAGCDRDVCESGETQSCTCAGGVGGEQVCADGGQAWDVCDCGGGDDDATGDDDVTGDDDTTGDDDDDLPPPSGQECEDTEPNNEPFVTEAGFEFELPSPNAQGCAGIVTAGGEADRLHGVIDPIVDESWDDSDNDAYNVHVTQDAYVNGILDWPDEAVDLDWLFYCFMEDDYNPLDWYLLMEVDLTASADKPEAASSVTAVPAGADCFVWIVGYSGADAQDYELMLWSTEEPFFSASPPAAGP